MKGGAIQSARVGLTGATTHAVRLTGVEKALAGKKADGIAAAVAAAAGERRRPQRATCTRARTIARR